MKKIGRYDIVEQLGQGASGVVYKASDPTIGRMVAIKVLSLDISGEEGVPGAREMFKRETRAAGRLSHPGIVAIHDALEDPQSKSSCIVMEFVSGRTLETVLLSGTRLTLQQSLEITRQVAEALDYAHRNQVIHRDLKPANVLITDDNQAKITDFGIAKIMAREGARRTLSVMGTPSYMSPEQVSGEDVDARSDLFSLGIVLYLLLTGQKPFQGDTGAVMFKIAYEDPVAPSRINPQLGPGHDYLVLRCLAKDRKKRYSTARELLDDLYDVQHGRPPRSQASYPTEGLRSAEPTLVVRKDAAAPKTSRVPDARKRPVWVIAACTIIFLATLSGFGVWIFRHRKASSPSSNVTRTIPASPGAPEAPLPAPSPGVPLKSSPLSSPSKRESARSSIEEARKPSQPPAPPQGLLPGSGKRTKSSAPANQTVATTSAAPLRATSPKITPPTATNAGSGPSRTVQLVCHHQLEQATLTISSGNRTISNWTLKGIKKGRLLGIKRSYAGTLSRSIRIPEGARELSVHVVSPDGSVDLSQTIRATPPGNAPATLQVFVRADQITLQWESTPRPTP